MFEKIGNFFNKMMKPEVKELTSKDAAKERLHLVLMQDRANVSVDFLELMKQEIIDVIKKYIEIDETSIDVRLTNQENEDGTNGAPSLYANIPILNIKNDVKAEKIKDGTLKYEKGELEKAEIKETKTEDNVLEETPTVEEVVEKIEEHIEEIVEDVPEVKVQVKHIVNDEPRLEDTEKATEVMDQIKNELEAEESSNEAVPETNKVEEENEVEEETIDALDSEDNEDGEDDEDDEDVTFDDLLKKAEEEEKAENIPELATEHRKVSKKKKSGKRKRK